jgi:hypothetical protein
MPDALLISHQGERPTLLAGAGGGATASAGNGPSSGGASGCRTGRRPRSSGGSGGADCQRPPRAAVALLSAWGDEARRQDACAHVGVGVFQAGSPGLCVHSWRRQEPRLGPAYRLCVLRGPAYTSLQGATLRRTLPVCIGMPHGACCHENHRLQGSFDKAAAGQPPAVSRGPAGAAGQPTGSSSRDHPGPLPGPQGAQAACVAAQAARQAAAPSTAHGSGSGEQAQSAPAACSMHGFWSGAILT